MKRRLVRVLPFAWPLAGLLILVLVATAMFEDQPDPPLFVTARDTEPTPGQISAVKFARLPSVDLERLPALELEVPADISPETGTSNMGSVLILSDLILTSEQDLKGSTEELPTDSLGFADDVLADTRDSAEKRDSGMQAIDVVDSSGNGVLADVTKTLPPPDIALILDATDIEFFGEGDLQTAERSDDEIALKESFAGSERTNAASTFVLAPEEDQWDPTDSTPVMGNSFEVEPEFARRAEPNLVSPIITKPTAQECVSEPESVSPVVGQVADVPAAELDSNLVAEPVAISSNDWSPLDIRDVKFDSRTIGDPMPMARQASNEGRQEAEAAVRLGFELVQRGAPFSARARFIEALRTVARSLDDRNFTSSHTAALRRALSAYQEAGDFFPKSTRPDGEVNLEFVVGGHATNVLQHADVQNMTPRRCVREYVAYAEQEFAKALGEEEVGSRALYGLGRLEWATTTTSSSSTQVRTYRAMSLYQAAMVVNPENYAAANELGVLLARYGKIDAAILALRHSVKHSPQPTAWKNLASLYRRVGQVDQAQQAEFEALQAANTPSAMPYAVANPRIEWVEPERFSRMSSGQTDLQVAQLPAEKPMAQPSISANKKSKRSIRRPWPFGRSSSR